MHQPRWGMWIMANVLVFSLCWLYKCYPPERHSLYSHSRSQSSTFYCKVIKHPQQKVRSETPEFVIQIMPFRCVWSASNCRLESLKCKVSQALPGAAPQVFLALKTRPQTILFWPQTIHTSLTPWSYYLVIAPEASPVTLHRAIANLCGKAMNIWASMGSVSRSYTRVTLIVI